MTKGNSNPLTLPIPIFTGEKYDIWSTKMKTYFLSQDLWDIVNEELSIPENTSANKWQLKAKWQKDAAALYILQQAVDDNICSKIYKVERAKEAWNTLKEEFQGNSQPTILSDEQRKEVEAECKKHLPLYKAILEGNLETVREHCDTNKDARKARITVNLDTALHVAVGTGKANHIVEYLLKEMSVDQLAQKNKEGNTILSVAAIVGNLTAASMILMKDKYLTLIQDSNLYNRIPLIEAARHGQKKMIKYLLQFSNNYLYYVAATRFSDESGVSFLNSIITAGFYGLALKLLQKHGNLATKQLATGESLLSTIAGKPSAFRSGQKTKRKYLQFFKDYKPGKPSAIPVEERAILAVQQAIPAEERAIPAIERVIPAEERKKSKFNQLFKFVCCTKEKRKTKSMHQQALLLVKHLCKEITKNQDYRRSSSILKQAFLLAAELGVSEVVEVIMDSFPDAIWFTNEKNHNIFHLAVLQRRENVFQLIYHMSGRKELLLMSQDVDKNNILHLAGKLAPKSQLNRIPSAAIQMQQELQWYKEVEKLVPPDYKEEKNSKGETPHMVFMEEHKELVKEGAKWMKDSATSFSLAAALIATIVFAAAITVPGDYSDDGRPTFHNRPSFTVFAISDSLSLFSSVAAIIIFLSVLTARYSEHDFLYSVPKKFMWGLLMLFLSLTALMVAFCSTVYLVFGDRKEYWILYLVYALASVPLFLFLSWQYPLLRDLLISTYGPKVSSMTRRCLLGISQKLRAWYEKSKKRILSRGTGADTPPV